MNLVNLIKDVISDENKMSKLKELVELLKVLVPLLAQIVEKGKELKEVI
ncbi:hypothetical protein IJI31_06525 [bacterium]|nr:hypothetical protein [bacterium]